MKSSMPEVQSPLPAGPEMLLEIKGRALMPCVYHFYKDPPQIVSGAGCVLTDHTGREYLDCYSGVTVMSAGHCNPAIIEPAIDQIRTLQHTTTIYLTEPILRLAERLAQLTPGGLCRSFFCASGSEATEGAMALATRHTQRRGIIAFNNALHGRTRWSMNATGLDMWRGDSFPLPDVHHARFGDIEDLKRIIGGHPGQISAIIAEPIQGNGGIIIPPDEFLAQVRGLCDEHGIVLIFDEIQSGFNRTGGWFACEHFSVIPDIMCVSKALGNGFPIAAFIATEEVAQSHNTPGASTYGGNPVCATAALATLDFHESNDLGANALARGQQLREALDRFADRFDWINPPRGLGLMLGLPITFPSDQTTDATRCDAMLEALKDRGVLAGKTGDGRNVLTFMPPLIIDEHQISILINALEESIIQLNSSTSI